MEKNKFNVIIFEDDQPSGREQRESRTANGSKSNQGQGNQHQYEIIEHEIQYLAEKVKNLEAQTENLNLFKNDSNLTQRQSMTNIQGNSHAKEVLIAIEKKIQIIVKQTKKIVDKMGENFQKKLENKLTKKYDELGVNKIKENYNASVRKIEQNYKREIETISKEYKQAEGKMVARVSEVEQRFLSKMNDFEIKEKEYVAWIHHLEIQLKERQQKSRKMIEVTQEKVGGKKEQSQASSIMSNNVENNFYSSNNNQPQPNQRATIIQNNQNDNSKIQRKHRIFDNANKGSSISPNKPSNSANANVQGYSSTGGVFQSTKIVNPAIRTKPLTESEPVQQQVTISLATKMTEPLRNNFAPQNESSPWRLIDNGSDKRTGEVSGRNRVIENVKQEQFYKDVPKANTGWDKFQDFKENDDESSDSEEDVLFYREGDQHEEFLQNFRSTKYKGEESVDPRRGIQDSKKDRFNPSPIPEQKVFSPFDLN